MTKSASGDGPGLPASSLPHPQQQDGVGEVAGGGGFEGILEAAVAGLDHRVLEHPAVDAGIEPLSGGAVLQFIALGLQAVAGDEAVQFIATCGQFVEAVGH